MKKPIMAGIVLTVAIAALVVVILVDYAGEPDSLKHETDC